MIGLKSGVRLKGLQPEMLVAMLAVEQVFNVCGSGCMITSGLDGKHMKGSLHYTGMALDFRIHNLPEAIRAAAVAIIKHSLGRDYDVVMESDHLHVEFDPK